MDGLIDLLEASEYMPGKHLNGLRPVCPVCGRRAAAFTTKKGFMLHCPGCGATAFFNSPVLLERIATGDPLCSHGDTNWTQAKKGWTKWCNICRLRLFAYQPPKVVANAPLASPLQSP